MNYRFVLALPFLALAGCAVSDHIAKAIRKATAPVMAPDTLPPISQPTKKQPATHNHI